MQLIYVLDDPRLSQECLALAKRCNALYSIPFELVINPVNLGYAGANNRGFAYAKAPYLLLLNSDVLPATDDSFELLIKTLQQHPGQVGAVGARLLFDNGAIQHQGMEFVLEPDLDGELAHVWLNEHPLKGVKIPAVCDSASAVQEVEAATGACLLLRRDVLMSLGGLSTHYIVGDFEDSDLCLKLRQAGLAIMVNQASVFYHLERQSLSLDPQSDAFKMKLVTSNALTHHQCWSSMIERLHASLMGI
jgi:GT2 family glycosyltransferase